MALPGVHLLGRPRKQSHNAVMNSQTHQVRKNSRVSSRSVARFLLAFGPVLLLGGVGAGCAGTATRPSTGEAIDDGVVSTRVKTALLRDDGTPGTAIQVETFRGTVQLSGFVNTAAQKTRAVEIARATPGVASVVDNIVVKQ